MMLVACRWTGVLLLLTLFARKYVIQDWPLLRTRLPYLFAMGALGFTIFNTMFYIASSATVGLNIGILQGSIPVFILIISFTLFRETVSTGQIFGIAISLIGVATVVAQGDLSAFSAFQFNSGDLLMLAACGIYALYTVKLRDKPNVSAMGLFSVLAAAAFIVAIPLVIYEFFLGDFIWPTTQGWIVIVLATLLPSFVAQVFFIKGVEMIGAARAGIFANLVPIFGAFLVVLILNETIKPYHIVSLALVFLGIWISERSKNRTPIESTKVDLG